MSDKEEKQKKRSDPRKWWEKLLYFFPLQLLFVHLKKNQQMLIFWVFLFLVITGNFGSKFGVPYLFLAPEYLGEVSIWSFAIFGFALGGFVMAFNIASYIMNGFRFPFLATLSKPFLKYSINNSTIPVIFIGSFVYLSSSFLMDNEGYSQEEVIWRQVGFLGGYFSFIVFALTYFMMTNKDFEKLFGKEIGKVVSSDTKGDEPARILLQKREKEWYKEDLSGKSWRVDTYIGSRFAFKLTRPYGHYDRSMLSQVFRQNHINASFFEIVVIASIIILGLFRDNPSFIIPAAASFFLLLTMLIMFVSALRSWIRGWTVVVLIGGFLLVNYISKYEEFYYINRLYGLDYQGQSANYPPKQKNDKEKRLLVNKDLEFNRELLSKWEAKNLDGKKKPKAVFIALSGGGSRSALWSFLALQHLDSLTDGELMNHSVMMTGSSGGTIGASYFREIWKRGQENDSLDPYSEKYRWDMGKDLLNPIMFTLTVNDIFVRTKSFIYQGQSHWKDRGYVFENTLNKNSRGMLDKPLGDYAEAEHEARIPFMIMSPSIINDSRRLLISNVPLSFMSNSPMNSELHEENVEYMRLFEENSPENARYLSLLRMNATFPYIMPLVDMPTEPRIEVFDSGLRDNYGIKTVSKYIFSMRDWLKEHTSGIVIVQFRNGIQKLKNEDIERRGIAEDLSSPFGSLYGNLFQVQDFNNDELLEYTKEWYQGPVDLVRFELHKDEKRKISLSWHLTSREKEMILVSLFTNNNQKAAAKLQRLLE
ncbi:MAG: hypothetical protein CMP59_01385 [Flavobacteriales bacterium]|nr:hypothetical protein [Flavobacteriales bacterium]